ncbi:hypothetical protein [Polynucleobacter sp. AP-Reno-20A-A9]|uniref:hypothetical protein n=1 Tax=Polynucleobacter sp. AP-Reno-20A-A9 TaxID=2576925 RepID=UPI001C0C2514|nr:hypothetical protein [Polynucleobacter sp. AP-Reno-20A-A9]MBU3628218.1 hypothetical protein [Polynucleobacter sp. AP-Reno-20A-A9]
MKKIIILLVSTLMLAPALVSAQTTPSVIGTLSWTLSPGLTSPSTTVYPPTWQGKCGPTPPSACIQQMNTPNTPYCPPPTPNLYPYCSVTAGASFTALTATVTDTGNGYYSLSGQGTINLVVTEPSHQTFSTASALTGSMFLNDGWYLMTLIFTAYPVPVGCSLNAVTLSGECVGVTGSTSPITLVVK